MVKDYYPISIEKIHNEILDENKINYLIHDNFCRYKYEKGKNKGILCLNRFKDVNELKYCHTHRWEMKPWLICNTNGCNGKTKINTCRKCKKILNTKLPDITNEEILDLSSEYVHKEIIKKVIPNAKYRIRNYNIHNYYKKHTIRIDLIIPKYINNLKIKRIKNDEYCKYFMNINKYENKFLNDINSYIIYLDNLFNKFKLVINLIIKIKRIRKKYESFKNICNIQLPPVTYEEEILLKIDFNNLYKKTKINKKDSNVEVLELNISEKNNNIKCNKCLNYNKLIKDMANITHFIINDIIDTFYDVNKHNETRIIEILNILKKPKIKPVDVNKLYNEYPKILSYNDKFIKILKEEVKELDIISCNIFNNIDKFISVDIYSNKIFKKYIC